MRAEDLFDLIHQVNPTHRGHPAEESQRRYALKRRLQSLLIRRFGERDVVVRKTADDGVVSLDHRSGLRDACHTVTAELELDARSWVQRQLDLAESSEAAAGDSPPAAAPEPEADDRESVSGLLLAGRKALEEYDYPRAEELLERAFAASRGSLAPRAATAAAEALLDLRVEVLGMDAAALALAPSLSAGEKAAPRVRAALALAAARTGDAERALEWVNGSTPAGASPGRLAEVYVALASLAITGRDRPAARRYLDLAADFEPTHPRLGELAREIEELRAEDLRRAEEALERRCRQLGDAAVEGEARSLADRWPEGEVARGILRRLAGERRRARIRQQLAHGMRARSQGRFAEAAEHLQAALDAGCDQGDLPDLIAETAHRAREEREREQVARTTALLEEGRDGHGRRAALASYLALAPSLRSRVRDWAGQEILGWLEDVGAPRSGSRVHPAVDAVLALESARSALEGGDAQAALARIEPYRAILRSVKVARSLWQTAGRRLARRARSRARERLEEAAAALREGQATRSRRLLDEVSRGDLSARGLERARRLERRLEATDRLARLEGDYHSLLAAEDLTAALDRARELARRTAEESPETSQRWRRRLARLQRRLREAWRLEIVPEPPGAEHVIPSGSWPEKTAAWLPDGEGGRPAGGRDDLFVAAACERWLFIDRLDLLGRRIAERVSLQTPRPLGQPLTTRHDGDRLWIAGSHGDVLELDATTWNLLGFYPLSQIVTGDRRVARVWLPPAGRPPAGRPPAGRWAWLSVYGFEDTEDQLLVVDLKTGRLSRRIETWHGQLVPVVLGDEPAMLAGGLRVYRVDGELRSSQLLEDGLVIDADVGPDGHGLLALVTKPAESGEEEANLAPVRRVLLRLCEPTAGEPLRVTARLELPEAHPYLITHQVVSAPELGRSYALIHTRDDRQEVLAFSRESEAEEPGRLTPVARSHPERLTLAHEVAARRVFDQIQERIQTIAFALATQRGPADPGPPPVPAPRYRIRPGACGQPIAPLGELRDALETCSAVQLRSRLMRSSKETAGEPEATVQLVWALLSLGWLEELRSVITTCVRHLEGRQARHPGVRLLVAELAADEEDWDAVRRALRGAPPEGLDAQQHQHFHHLMTLARLHGGDLEAAHAACLRGLAVEGGQCHLETLEHLTRPTPNPPAPEEWSADQPLTRRLVGVIRTADHALAQGDREAARVALDRPDIRWQRELQSAARRAKAYLERGPAATPADRFDERFALAFFVHLQQQETWLHHDVELPGLHWGEEKLAALAEAAAERLDAPWQ